ncbi:MAG: rhomboid family intramembrane serine protease [Candidatus Marinimicrobia bacterium]|nr:rhomboid family intramembrane serine protease [Candidatus Neomarinimicrobiota bacterium]MCF7903612.1 rhomboid family intramembrane serine protease [Candidatus Neomarinimicrobiota bacterium]
MNQWQYNQGPQQMRFGPRQMGDGVKQLLIANAVVFVLTQITNVNVWADWFGLNPHDVIFRVRLWQPFSYMFLHANFWHIGINMLMLWMFGSELETIWGKKEFIRYYMVTGVGAGLFSLVPYFIGVLTGYSGYIPSIIGASGAVYGILLAYAMTYPNRTVLVYFIMPVKVKYLMLFMGFMTFASVGNSDGISHITHLGGLVVGWFYLRRHRKYRGLNLPWRSWFDRILKVRVIKDSKQKKPRSSSRGRGTWHRVESEKELRQEMDDLLDKITRVGYEALSDAEKKRMLELSSKLSDKTDNPN